ncbi:MAG: hypothetical protein IPH77_07870 [Ignavibacteria bacterium]|nr:hypothetical protein [Ignavibacteria bacterium]
MAQEENEGLQNVWKSPLAGFYTYGEFGMTENGNRNFIQQPAAGALKEK